jgi:hypothetical protein
MQGVKYVRSIGVGVTKPHIIKADDGHLYVVKLADNKLGKKALANEFIAYNLAYAAELSFLPSSPLELTKEFLEGAPPLKKCGASEGMHFAVRYLKKSGYVQPHHMAHIVNKKEFAGVILFDHLLQNEDRTLNGRNLLVKLTKEGLKLYAIDNTHIFGSGNWQCEDLLRRRGLISLNRRRAYGVLLKKYLKEADFLPFAARLKNLSKETVGEIMAKMPPWLKKSEMLAAEDYINWRLAMTDEILAEILRLLPDKHRRSDFDKLK